MTSGRPRRTAAAARQPKYLRIYDDLASRITAGEYTPGTSLPSQRELSDHYQVTLMTLRQAIELLEGEALVETRPGIGTFVALPRYTYDVGHLRSFAADMALQGAAVETRIIKSQLITAPAAVAAHLALPRNGRAFAIRRVRLIDGRPVVRQDSYLPPRLGRRLDVAQLRSRSLYTVLADDLGATVTRANETIRPTILDTDDAALLARDPGSVALLSHRVSFDAHDTPVIDDLAVLPGDSVVITADRSPEGLRLSYTFERSPN